MSSVRPSDGIGARVANYRRLSGLTARELAERAGLGLTRGIITNIENGRKTDITVDQLIAIATVLGVPPAVIALPVDRPYHNVQLNDPEDGQATVVPSFEAVGLFIARESSAENAAAFLASQLVRSVWELNEAVRANRSQPTDENIQNIIAATLADLEPRLRRLGASLDRPDETE